MSSKYLTISRHRLDSYLPMALFSPNIDIKGRAVRGAVALTLAIGAGFTWRHSRMSSAALAIVAGFVGFEAARGWCAARACGLKTPL